jgi:hypothetical protein
VIYEYKCRMCGQIESTTRHRGDRMGDCTNPDCSGSLTRLFSVSVQRPLHEHWNPTVNAVVSSNAQFDDMLKRKSDEATENTGIEHRFVRHDPADTQALKVTSEGIEESNKVRRAQGMRELPTPV